jgi:ornithine cyclodeaminase/alanine dehydrogenase
VRGSDVVVTATMFYLKTPLVRADWFAPGAFAAPLEADYAWEPAAIKLADKFVTDDAEQTRHFAAHGCFPQGMPPLHAELGELVCGKKPGREHADERTMAICLGMALIDVVMGRRLYDMAGERGIGTKLPLA